MVKSRSALRTIITLRLFLAILAHTAFFVSPRAYSSEKHYVSHCQILDEKFKVFKSFPGRFCSFFKDGSFVSGEAGSLSYFAADMSKRWSKKIHTHHQVNQASEGKILVMSSQFERTRGYYVRHDKLLVLNQTGKILKSWSARGHIKQLLKLAGIEKEEFYKFEWDKEALDKFKIKSAYEYSHLNSFYEISSESAEKNLPQFKKGNFIANFNMLGIILVFDKDLKEILWSQKYPLDKRAHIHDVQVMDNGNILIFNNNNFGGEGNHSTIDEWNPVEKKMAWQFKANPPERFFSGIVGGVQLLSSGNFLLTNINARGDLDFKQTEVLEISREGKIVSSTPIDWEGARPMVQQIKQVDLTDFLNSNKSL